MAESLKVTIHAVTQPERAEAALKSVAPAIRDRFPKEAVFGVEDLPAEGELFQKIFARSTARARTESSASATTSTPEPSRFARQISKCH